MFERYTQKARRVIFFARYEASQYGSPYIETEHLLLGLLREDFALMSKALGPSHTSAQIRTEIERVITKGARISTSVEMPLSADSRKILILAGEEADGMKHRHVGTEHLLLGVLRVSDCLAAKLITARGVKAEKIREQIASGGGSAEPTRPSNLTAHPIDSFLGTLKGTITTGVAEFFGTKGQYIDSNGKCWTGCEEIAKEGNALFAPFAKKNATFLLEGVVNSPRGTVVATVLWEFAACAGQLSKSIHRMSIVMAPEGGGWAILLVQVTPVIPGPTLSL
jgi:Clp amino terminal domain, pathogenicity island component